MKSTSQSIGNWLSKNTAATAVAAVIIALGNVFVDFRQQNRYDCQDLIAAKNEETIQLREIVDECYAWRLRHSEELAELKIKVVMLQAGTEQPINK
ncbi:MAG: hypothetical protein AAFQ37_13765 [Bacteroidota bacterium]